MLRVETEARGAGRMNVVKATGRHTLAAAATSTITLNIPATARVLDVSGILTTAITGPGAAWTLGDGTDADRFGTGLAIAVNTTFDMTDWTADGLDGTSHAVIVAAGTAWNLVLTGTGANFTGGVVDYQVIYEYPTPLSAALP
jgi:hypothetical protein